jgi:hypothetical protein
MFQRPFHRAAANQVKKSEAKKLFQRLEQTLPGLTQTLIREVIRGPLSVERLTGLEDGGPVRVFSADGTPWFFTCDSKVTGAGHTEAIYPTLYFLHQV